MAADRAPDGPPCSVMPDAAVNDMVGARHGMFVTNVAEAVRTENATHFG